MSVNMQRPPFHHYPLSIQQLADIKQEKETLEKDIRDNLTEIRLLNNKMAKNDYEETYLHKLKEREYILQSKRSEMEEILRTHHYLQEQVDRNRNIQQNLRSSLAQEYQQMIEDKKQRKIQERRQEIEREQRMLQYNQEMFQVEVERKKRQQEQTKRVAQEEVAMKEARKRKEMQDRQRQKYQFNEKMKMRNSYETQKQASYKQYYDQFRNGQDTLHNVYQHKTAPQNQEKERMMQEFLKKEQEEFAQQQARMERERIQRDNFQRNQLKNYLENQIRQKQMKKSLDANMRRSFHQQSTKYEQFKREQDLQQRQRKREDQRRYDEQLGTQIKMKNQIVSENSPSPHRLYNPITNPIDFKLGITNPYVIREYQQNKQRYMGDKDLKLKHLAMVGNNSLQQ